ncbi:type II toxin-antitoxin system RelE/ParE family toxin [Sphingomonas sp. RT2P30]|uniref:type II toxin-antitoxin system RelE/ParE family toxin n=1 Tax=Parasphingomonas halimpatiens TaxID=3096162 RepID=UPI002FCB04F4
MLSAAAEADLRDIIRHTRQRWGDAQVRSYIARLQVGIERVALGQGFFKDMTALYPGLRMAHCERHHAFCLPPGRCPCAHCGDLSRADGFDDAAGGAVAIGGGVSPLSASESFWHE